MAFFKWIFFAGIPALFIAIVMLMSPGNKDDNGKGQTLLERLIDG